MDWLIQPRITAISSGLTRDNLLLSFMIGVSLFLKMKLTEQ